MHHVFYIPSSYSTLIYSLITSVSLLLCLYVGLAKHAHEILATSCGPDHYEFWPSISTTIGDFMPQRQIWRSAFVLCVPFRLGASLALFSVIWQHGSGGVTELKLHWHHPRRLIHCSAFISVIMLMADLLRMWAAMGWTIIASFESLPYHNLHFVPYILLCFMLQVLLLKLVRRNMYNKHIYATPRDAVLSLRWKRALCWSETVTAIGVVGFYLRHYLTCKNGSFSLSTMNEWIFATCNIIFDCTMWYELKQEGWWLSGSPQIFRVLWQRASAQMHIRPSPINNVKGDATLDSNITNTAMNSTQIGNASNVNEKVHPTIHDVNDGNHDTNVRSTSHTQDQCAAQTANTSALQQSNLQYFINNYNSSGGNNNNNNNNSNSINSNTSFTRHGGESLIGNDLVVHRFTFCCPPFQLTLWMCYIYWYYLLFQMFVNLIEHMYFMPMVAMSVSWQVSSIVLMGAPCLLALPLFRRIATGPCLFAHSLLKPTTLPRGAQHRVVPMYVLFFFLASFSHLHMLVQNNSRKKILASSFGTFWLSLALYCRFYYPSPASPRGNELVHLSTSRICIYCLPLSLILCMLLRILYISQSPMFVEPTYSGVFGILLGLGFTTIIYREAMFAKPHAAPASQEERRRQYEVQRQNEMLFIHHNINNLEDNGNMNYDRQANTNKKDDDAVNNFVNNNNNNINSNTNDGSITNIIAHDTNEVANRSSMKERNLAMRVNSQVNYPINTNVSRRADKNASVSFISDHQHDGNGVEKQQKDYRQHSLSNNNNNNKNEVSHTSLRQSSFIAEHDPHVSSPSMQSSAAMVMIDDKDSNNSTGGLSGQDELEEENTIAMLASAYSPAPHWQLGFTLGLLNGAALTLLNSANYLPRMLAVEPYPVSFLVVAAFACGLVFSPDVLPVCPHLMRQKGQVKFIRRLMRRCFHQPWRNLSGSMFVFTVLMLWATRQTNFTYERRHAHYPVSFSSSKEHVHIRDWAVQRSFRGSKHVAFVAGLGVYFFLGVLCPVVCELCVAHVYQRRVNKLSHTSGSNNTHTTKKVKQMREPPFWTSLQLWWFGTVILICTCYVLCTVYPFVPLAWLIRQRSRSVIMFHLMSLLFMTWHISRPAWQVRKLTWANTPVQRNAVHNVKPSTSTSAGAAAVMMRSMMPNTNTNANPNETNTIASSIVINVKCRQQRLLHSFTIVSIGLCFIVAFVGRQSFRPQNVSFPANKQTVIKYSEQVMQVHDRLVALHTARNVVTDSNMKWYKRNYYEERRNDNYEALRKQVLSATDKESSNNNINITMHLQKHSRQVRQEIWQAANALTFFSGMIWTIHFAQDNNNVDSMGRILWQIQRTNAGVVGLLESDGMHVTNGNRDFAEYLSYYLGFQYTDYGPTALDNTFGCTLLSRYPITKVHRYVAPSPLGELACIIHAELDVFGLRVQTFVGHFGNTEHWADGLLQSQFLGQLALQNPGPAIWLGYLVTYPGNKQRYHMYSDPVERGKFRDSALQLYIHRPWTRLWERGGYDEPVTSSTTAPPGSSVDFNVDYKVPLVRHLEGNFVVNESFRRTPFDKPKRHFYFNATNRYTHDHPRFEFIDRYCQYCLFKRGVADEQLPQYASKLQPVRAQLYDWWRVIGNGVQQLSDTEIQVIQMRFYLNK